jgi:hypothetical protein
MTKCAKLNFNKNKPSSDISATLADVQQIK